MQLFIDESGDFNINTGQKRFHVVAGLALPESPPYVMELVARQLADLEERSPLTWRKNGEIKGTQIPPDELCKTLTPILDIKGPVFVVAAFIDRAYQETEQVATYQANRLDALERERNAETDRAKQCALTSEMSFVRAASGAVLMRSYVALPQIVAKAMIMMQPYYEAEFEPALKQLTVIVDRDSFLGSKPTRRRVIERRVIEELAIHEQKWGFQELRQWHDRGIRHPGELLAERRGLSGKWELDIDYELNADAAGRPLVLLGDLVAAAIRKDLETAFKTTASTPIIFAERRVFPVLTGLGSLPEAEQKKALEVLSPLLEAWGVRFSNSD